MISCHVSTATCFKSQPNWEKDLLYHYYYTKTKRWLLAVNHVWIKVSLLCTIANRSSRILSIDYKIDISTHLWMGIHTFVNGYDVIIPEWWWLYNHSKLLSIFEKHVKSESIESVNTVHTQVVKPLLNFEIRSTVNCVAELDVDEVTEWHTQG